MSNALSTVGYLSNIQIVKNVNDTEYIQSVHDPFALERMQKLIDERRIVYKLTPLQEKEMRAASTHCSYAFKNDYPWGTIEINGTKKVICKCLNQDCGMFGKCRENNYEHLSEELYRDTLGMDYDQEGESYLPECFALGNNFKESILGKVINSGRESNTSNEVIKPYLTAIEIEEKPEEIAIQVPDIEQKPTDITEDIIVSENSDQETLNDFFAWMLEHGYEEIIASRYRNDVKSSDVFARKKKIWKNSILFISDVNVISKMIASFQSNRFYKVAMSNYVIALKCYANYRKDEFFKEREDIVANTKNEQSGEGEVTNYIQQESSSMNKSFDSFTVVNQEKVIQADTSQRIIVNAGPGTGKTFTLIARIIDLVNKQHVDPEEILVLCFSRAAVEVIENRLRATFIENKIGMNWHSIDIRTFDSFTTHLLSYVAENERNLVYEDFAVERLDYDGRISSLIDVLKKKQDLLEQCTHLIVDEVQDLVSLRAKLVMEIISNLPQESGYTLLGDSCQAIYDYQIQSGEIDSTKFYNWLFTNQNNSSFYSFDQNYRQTSMLQDLGNSYRLAILSGTNEDRIETAKTIHKNICDFSDVDLRNIEYEELLNKIGDGTIGILTRTNGQALKISTWFRNADIPHKVQKRLTDNSLNSWIASVFRTYDNDMISKDTFVKLFGEKGDYSIDPEEIWNAIGQTQYESKESYRIEDILNGIINNGKTELFYTYSDDDQITISNIHRAKGREFDNVVLLDDTLISESENEKDLLEHKVSYVAVTRAKHKIFNTNIGNQYIKTDKKGDRRAYAMGMNFIKKKSNLSHIEVGRNYDVDEKSFAMNSDVQLLFDDPLSIIGERVKLIKNKILSDKEGYVIYDIFLEENMSIGALGTTSKKFYKDLKRIIKTIHKLPNDAEVYSRLYPSRFSEVYIDDVISVISKYSPDVQAGRRYGNSMIWKGITLIGFAQVERDTY